MASTKKSSKKTSKSAAASTLLKNKSGKRESVSNGSAKHYVKRDEQGRFAEIANKHMERTWGKIYARRSKGVKAA